MYHIQGDTQQIHKVVPHTHLDGIINTQENNKCYSIWTNTIFYAILAEMVISQDLPYCLATTWTKNMPTKQQNFFLQRFKTVKMEKQAYANR